MRISSRRGWILPVVAAALVACGETQIATTPLADAGYDQSVEVGDEVTLDGRASSDPSGKTLSYRWELVYRPTSSRATLVPTDSPTPSFTADLPGPYLVRLRVSNGDRLSNPDELTVVAQDSQALNRAPVAVARACLVLPCVLPHEQQGSLMGGSSSDRDGDALSFLWTQVTSPGDCATACPDLAICNPIADPVTWIDETSSTATYDPPMATGDLVFRLTVSDPYVSSTACTSVTLTNSAPVGLLQTSAPSSIDEQGSFTLPMVVIDANADPMTYVWSMWETSAGVASAVDVASGAVPANNTPSPTLTSPAVSADTSYTLRFMLDDGLADYASTCDGSLCCTGSGCTRRTCCDVVLTVKDTIP